MPTNPSFHITADASKAAECASEQRSIEDYKKSQVPPAGVIRRTMEITEPARNRRA